MPSVPIQIQNIKQSIHELYEQKDEIRMENGILTTLASNWDQVGEIQEMRLDNKRKKKKAEMPPQ